jgi:hypothetical protein
VPDALGYELPQCRAGYEAIAKFSDPPFRPYEIKGGSLAKIGITIPEPNKTINVAPECDLVVLGGGTYVAIMNLMPLYFGKTHYPQIIGFALPFATILGSIGSPLTGHIRDITGSNALAWELAVFILTIGLFSLILVRPPVHPSLRENRGSLITEN